MKKTVAIALIVILLSVGLVAGAASADEPASQLGEVKAMSLESTDLTMALDGNWVILDQYMSKDTFFSGGPWTWDSPSLSVNFTITDLYVVSDQFVVYDNDVPVATTPSLPDWDVLGYADYTTSPPWTNDPDTALASGFFSSAVITFPPGKHSITIKDIHIPPRFAGGRTCSDGTVAFKAEQIDSIIIAIDIKPGSDPNSINLKSNGVVPVAVLTTDDFDASTIDPESVRFANASPEHWTLENVDGDGDIDLLFHFKTQELGLTEDSKDAALTGQTTDGHEITGTDSLSIVPLKDNK